MKFLIAFLTAAMVLIAPQAHSRDDKHMFSIKDAMQSAAFKEKLNPNIRFYFGKQKHSKVKRKFGNFTTSKKTNAFNKTDIKACQWVLLSGLIALQDRAVREGGNAVINIESNYKHNVVSSTTEFECHVGAIMAGAALKGDVVTLAK